MNGIPIRKAGTCVTNVLYFYTFLSHIMLLTNIPTKLLLLTPCFNCQLTRLVRSLLLSSLFIVPS